MLLKSLSVMLILGLAAVYGPKGCTDRDAVLPTKELGNMCYEKCENDSQVFTGMIDLTINLNTKNVKHVICECQEKE